MAETKVLRQRVAAFVAGIAVVAVTLAVIAAIAVVPNDQLPNLVASPQLVGHVAMAVAIVVAGIGILAFGEGYLAGVWVVASLIAWTAAAGSVVVYLATGAAGKGFDVRFASVYDGVAIALAVLAALAFLGREVCRPRRAQARIWDGIQDRHSQLWARFKELKKGPDPTDPARQAQNETALEEAEARFNGIEADIAAVGDVPAFRWALASGYSGLLRTLHRIEEMIIAAQPDHAVTGDALHDAMSLSNSTIAGKEVLAIRLRTAMEVISPNAARSFLPVAGVPADPGPAPAAAATAGRPSQAEAREVLREVRFAVNDFRDNRVDGIIRARNRLLWVVPTVGITAYFALALALIGGVNNGVLTSVSALYLVAALAGLINRLRIESSTGSAGEDYGLHLARLIATPLLSGLAGVGGVYLVAATSGSLNGTLELNKVFDLGQNQASLLVAATFGLVPAQLFSGLQRQAERFQTDLEKSEPAGGSTLTSVSG